MKLRTSKALSKKLYKAGLKQASEDYWNYYSDIKEWYKLEDCDMMRIPDKQISRYTLEELLVLVPKKIVVYGIISPFNFTYRDGIYTAMFVILGKYKHKDPKTAVSNLLKWLLDNGYMKRCKNG